MKLNLKDLIGIKLGALDGWIGQVQDFYFDDQSWTVRYLVVNTGFWLPGRLVLLSPHSFGDLDLEEKVWQVNLDRAQIENSPSIDAHLPISRRYEKEFHRYYGFPNYWDGDGMWGMGDNPVSILPVEGEPDTLAEDEQPEDIHLQSAESITGYHIQTVDETIGHVTGFLVDDRSWLIQEMVVETGNWFSGKEIIIPPSRINRISYEESKVFVHLTMEEIQKAEEHEIV